MESLLKGFLKEVRENPNKIALIILSDEEERIVTYKKLFQMAGSVAACILEHGVKEGDRVAVSLERGEKLVAVILGILWTGAVYVPVNPKQPLNRRKIIYEQAGIKYCITFEGSLAVEQKDCENIYIDEALSFESAPAIGVTGDEASAYVIFTSGSTGTPKGVEISHAGAMNTINDIIERFEVTQEDVAIAVSSVDFDLSVFDIFGMLSVGGRLLLLDEKNKREPSIWISQCKRYGVTIWNSVPALFEMLMYSLEEKEELLSLRLVLLSGDWVKPSIYADIQKHCKGARMIALGGATEASIWSNYFEVKEIKKEWNAIPYGVALRNQKYRIVSEGQDVAIGEIGKLLIGGMGLAKGYIGNEEQTRESFVMENGERWYHTGDLGYFNEKGIIIFVGRMDQQVKVNGLRIELGEVEGKLSNMIGIDKVTVLVDKSSGGASLEAAIVPERREYKEGDISIIEGQSKCEICESEEQEIQEAMVEFARTLTIGNNKIAVHRIPKNVKNAFFRLQNYAESHEDIRLTSGGKWWSTLKSRISVYEDIFNGKVSSKVILEDDILSPDRLFVDSQECMEILDELICKIAKSIEGSTGKIKIGLVYGGSGVVFERLLDRLEKSYADKIELCYFERSEGFIDNARKHFGEKKLNISYEKISYPWVRGQLVESQDILVALNSMHSFPEVAKGISYLQMLLKKGGALYAIETSRLPSISLANAVILENGFVTYEEGRRENPMLNAGAWSKVLAKSGFNEIYAIEYKKTGYIVLEAKRLRKVAVNNETVNTYAKRELLEYMIPQKYCYAVDYPLTGNGKVDRKSILEWFGQNEKKSGKEIVGDTEREIGAIFKELLGIKEVFADESFFEKGGDSLLLTKLNARIKECFGVNIAMKEIFENSTVEHIAKIVDKASEDMEFEEGEL